MKKRPEKIIGIISFILIIIIMNSNSQAINFLDYSFNPDLKKEVYQNQAIGPWLNNTSKIDIGLELIEGSCSIESDLWGSNFTIEIHIVGKTSGCDGLWIGYQDGHSILDYFYNDTEIFEYYWVKDEIEISNTYYSEDILYNYFIFKDLSLENDWSTFILNILLECSNSNIGKLYDIIAFSDTPNFINPWGIEYKLLANGYTESGYLEEWNSPIYIYGYLNTSGEIKYDLSKNDVYVKWELFSQNEEKDHGLILLLILILADLFILAPILIVIAVKWVYPKFVEKNNVRRNERTLSRKRGIGLKVMPIIDEEEKW